MKENRYQAKVKKRIEREFPGCVVIINDPSYIQGIPDLLVLYKNTWAMLEVKRSINEEMQPNQIYYIHFFGSMSFAAVIYPENEDEVLNELQVAFGNCR